MRPWLNYCFASLLFLTLSDSSLGQERDLNAQSPGDRLGVCVHFLDIGSAELTNLSKLGVTWVRQDLEWAQVESEKGAYNFQKYDKFVDIIASRGMKVLFILDYGNSIYGQDSPRTTGARAAFVKFACAAVARYSGRGFKWEIWNEPDINFWKPEPNAREYTLLATETAHALKKRLPKEQIIGPALSTVNLDFLESCLKAGLLESVDAVSIHPYRGSRPPETATQDFASLRAMLHKYSQGKGFEVLSSEWGYSEKYGGLDEKRQGLYSVRQALICAMNHVALSIWYDWKDDGTDSGNAEHHFGLIGNDGRIKEAYLAVRTFTSFTASLHYPVRIPTDSANDYILEFKGESETAYAAWSSDAQIHPIYFPRVVGYNTYDYLGRNTEGASPSGYISLSEGPKYFTSIIFKN